MRREGRQHGMVRAYNIKSALWDPRPIHHYPNELTSPPTAGLFTKVSTKPTNHSKFTGKCGRSMCRGCHLYHPACKSKDKVKGAHKVRSENRLVTFRVADAGPGLKFSGISALGVLDYLTGDEDYVDDYYEDNNVDIEVEIKEELCDNDDHQIEEIEGDNNNDDQMSFCEVGFVWEPVDGDDDWCLVEEM